ncbi:MAG: hypothetical protein R6U31_04800 [bacterium]
MFDLIIIIIMSLSLNQDPVSANYRFDLPAMDGSAKVTLHNNSDTYTLTYNAKAYFGLIKLNSLSVINKKPLKPISIETEYNGPFNNYTGGTLFRDSFAIYYKNSDSSYVQGKYPVNDWIILPFYLSLKDDSLYSCTMLQTDAVFTKTLSNDTIIWQDSLSDAIIKIYDNVPVYMESDNLTLIKE